MPGPALDIAGGVAAITLDRQDDANRMTPEDMTRLGEIVAGLAADETVNAVMVTGAGEDWFSAGLLNPDIRAAMVKEQVVAFVMQANAVLDALEALPQIVVCAMNAPVMAGAAELALACDIRVAADHATLTMPEARWGGFPGAGGPVRLPGVVGHGQAMRLIATAETIDAAEMLRIGFVEAVWPKAAFRARARAMVERIAESGPLATRGAKRIALTRRDEGFRAARALSDALRRELEWSADVDEGMAAHREGRAPRFTGK
jgi:enoyl-CoA hydratase/carnithine racemase